MLHAGQTIFYDFSRTVTIKFGTSRPQDVSINKIWDSYLKCYSRYASERVFVELCPEVKVTVTQKQYSVIQHCDPKMFPHTKFGIATSNNIGDMLQT